MLKGACRRFRAEFTPGPSGIDWHPHRRSCLACAAYAAALERAAKRVPLPARLRSKLRAISGGLDAAGQGPKLPLAQVPLPDALRDRLRGLAAERQPLPVWVRSSRYAVAASYLMAVLMGFAMDNPAHLGRQAAGAMSTVVAEHLAEGRERLDLWEDTIHERYGETRRSLEDSLDSLDHRVDEIAQSLRSLEPLITRRVR